MKTTKIILASILFTTTALFSQHSGNANSESATKMANGNYNYQNQYQNNQVSTIQTTNGNENEMYIVIKGIYNEKATS